ncbi:N-ethylmaleimide reductase [Mesorhizobium abyssinicae]
MPPLTRMRAGLADGVPSPFAPTYYAQRASEGGFLIGEATQISKQGQGYPGTPGIYSSAQVDAWRKVTRAAKAKGAVIFLQLWHVGRISHSSHQPDGKPPVAPSAMRPQGKAFDAAWNRVPYETPRALAIKEIAAIVADYRSAAANAHDAGFDGVELHGANGYLLDQFLEDSTNLRQDRYGGAIENRTRLLLEAIDAVSEVWGADRVGVRLSPFGTVGDIADSDPQRLFEQVIKALAQRGIAYLHLIEPRANAGIRDDLNLAAPPSVAALFRHAFNGPLIASGGFDRISALAAVESGIADAVAFGRAFIANPDLPQRLAMNAPLNTYDQRTVYGGAARGYTDYSAWKQNAA